MRIITEKQLLTFIRLHRDAESSLKRWLLAAKAAQWTSLAEIRKTYRDADEVIVQSGKPVVIFNIGGNKYRLITAVHYNMKNVYVMMFLTHAEYDKEAGKRNL